MDKLTEKIKSLDGQFDTEEPGMGHFDRFAKKLDKKDKQPKQMASHWKWLSIAASIALVLGYYFGTTTSEAPQALGSELAEVSPEMEETQSFFLTTLQHEMNKVNEKRTTDNQQVIDDAMAQLTTLENNYRNLKLELSDSNYDRRIIFAMITNFQQRVEVLQTLLTQLEELEQLKTANYEDTII